MNTRVILAVVLSAVFAIGAGLLFPEVVPAKSSSIGIYVLLACLVVNFTSLTTTKSLVSDNDDDAEAETTTLYVGNLPYKANEEAVRQFFDSHVSVHSVRLMKDKRTGKRKGYGFIEVVTNNVDGAIDKLNDIVFQERTLKVRPAKEKVEG